MVALYYKKPLKRCNERFYFVMKSFTSLGMKKKSILITGASSGIGEALAYHYAREGATLFICGRNEARLNKASERCRRHGAQVSASVIDVTDKKAVTEWVEAADNTAPLDLVIANAGISGGTGGRSTGEDLQEAERIWQINLQGKINTVHAVLPRMIEREDGQIALMSSLAGFSGWPGAPSYSASKGAVRLYGEALRGTMAPLGVKINVICPGFVKSRITAMNDYKMPFLMDSAKAAKIIARGLKVNKGRIAFPLPTFLFAGLIGILPHFVSSRILAAMPAKPPRNAKK